jgi:putative sigma-54 modulation protein
MDTSMSGRHMALTAPIKKYTREKMDKLVKFYKRITKIKTILFKESTGFKCEIILTLPGHKNIVINKEAENLYSAIDNTFHTCERKLKQYKDKRRQRKGHFHDVPKDQ